ncbi:MAG: T9SS type A sorting domain-containing protein [Bacteroidota bacterium]|nr:T9SS type A sorting domain-containing protein [Bacteroidota bacterium]
MNKSIKRKILLLILYNIINSVSSQNLINNGNFDYSTTGINLTPFGWNNCNGTPDVQPRVNFCQNGYNNMAVSDSTYLGLASFTSSSHEIVSSTLFYSIRKNSKYKLIAYNRNLINCVRTISTTSANYDCNLNIYLGNSICDNAYLVYSKNISVLQLEWRKDSIIFDATDNFNQLSINAVGGSFSSYIGIDNISLIKIFSTPSISGINVVCMNQVSDYTIESIIGINFSISVSGNNVFTLSGNNLKVRFQTYGITTITGNFTDGTYTGVNNLVVTVTDCNPPLQPTITGVNTICNNTNTTFSISTQLGVGLNLFGFQNQNGSALWSVAGVYTLTATAINTYGTVSGYYTVTVTDCRPPMQPTISGVNSICNNTNTTYAITTQSGVGLNLIGFQNQNGLASWSVAGIYTLTATAINIFGTVSGFYTVTVTDCSPPMQPTITGINTVCSGVSTTFQISTQTGVQLTLQGFQNQNGLASWSVPGVNTLTAIAFNNYGTITGIKIITVFDCGPSVPVISGPNTVCSGVATTFQISTQTGVTLNLSGFQNQLGLASWTSTGIFVLTATAINSYGTISGFKTVQVLSCMPPSPCTINKCYPSYNFFQKGDTVTIGSYSGCDPGLSITGIRWMVINKYSSEPNPTFIFKDTAKITSGDVIISITGSNGCVYSNKLLSFTIDRNAPESKPVNTCVGSNCNTGSISNVESLNFKLYPNPFSGFLNIEVNKPGQFIIYDTFGTVVYERQVNGYQELDLQNLAKGLYYYRFVSSGEVKQGKVVRE